MNKELYTGIFILAVGLLLLIRSEFQALDDNTGHETEIRIDQKEACDHIRNKLGSHVTISFVRELNDKYYFKVSDPEKECTYDVYVGKQLPMVQAIRKTNKQHL